MKPTKNLKKFLKELKRLNLPTDQFAVFGGGPLAVRGIREIKDLDLLVLPELWGELTKKYPVEKTEWGGKIHLAEDIEAVDESILGGVEESVGKADIFKGIRFVNLKRMIEWKRKMGRENDLKDIELIEEYLKVGGK